MTIKKFQGKTKEEAIMLAKEQMGDSIVIMNTREMKPEGVFGIFKKSIIEVTVAIEDEPAVIPFPGQKAPTFIEPSSSTFSVVADENINISYDKVEESKKEEPKKEEIKPAIEPTKDDVNAMALKSVFKEINEVLENNKDQIQSSKTYSKSNIIKKEEVVPVEKKEMPEPIVKQEEEPVRYDRKQQKENNLAFVKMVYTNLLANEVEERYINQIMDDMSNIISSTNSIDYLISNVYQKLVLKLGEPKVISMASKGPKIIFFVGPTGVGKTTTIAKLASTYKIGQKKSVAFITADTYRIAATEQLNVYANILDAPISIVYSPSELNDAVEKLSDNDLIFVDTVGFSHKNSEQKEGTKALIDSLDEKYPRDIYLVLSVTTKYNDLKEIADIYKSICDYNLIFTKLDETSTYGNILNLRMYTGVNTSYVTTGQNVPDDIEIIDSQKIVKQYLGGR